MRIKSSNLRGRRHKFLYIAEVESGYFQSTDILLATARASLPQLISRRGQRATR